MTFPNVLWRHGPQWHHAVRALEHKYFARLVPGLAVNPFFVPCLAHCFVHLSLIFCTAIVLVPAALETICVKSLLWPLRLALRRRLSTRTNGILRRSRMDGMFRNFIIMLCAEEQSKITRKRRKVQRKRLDRLSMVVVTQGCLEAC